MAPWHTFDITGDNVSSHDGLLRSWKRAINELYWHTHACKTSRARLPILSHVDIYGRSMKTMYVAGLHHIKTRKDMAKHPLLFGLWRGYKWMFLRCTMHTDHIGLHVSFLPS